MESCKNWREGRIECDHGKTWGPSSWAYGPSQSSPASTWAVALASSSMAAGAAPPRSSPFAGLLGQSPRAPGRSWRGPVSVLRQQRQARVGERLVQCSLSAHLGTRRASQVVTTLLELSCMRLIDTTHLIKGIEMDRLLCVYHIGDGELHG